MKNSPLNLLGNIFSTAAMGGMTNNSSGDLTSMGLLSSLMGKSSRKLKPRVKKLENQVSDLLRNKYSNKEPEYNTTVGDNPSQQTPYDSFEGPEPYQGGAVDITGNSQVGGPNTAVAGQQMFGEQMPGSFDRDMGM